MERPGCVHVPDLPEEQRPRFLKDAAGVRSRVREVGKAAGLTRMGVSLRTIQPGDTGTARHYHDVEEEWVWVLAGTGTVRIGPHRLGVRPGSFVGFPPGPAPHHFLATGDVALVLLEGGESRKAEDSGRYVDLGLAWGPGRTLGPAETPPPPERGDPGQCIHIDDLEPATHDHDVDPKASRLYRSLHRPTGLTRQAVRWSKVAAGAHSTAYHFHDRTDEWVYVLAGRARARVGDARFEVGPGDFLAHPAGGAPHVMEPITDLEYLMGGMIDPDDVVVYPEAGVERVHDELRPRG